jgi:hypothetical protein
MKTGKKYSLFVLLSGIATFATMILLIAISGGEVAKPAEYPNKQGFTQAIFFFEMAQTPEEVKAVLGDPSSPEGARMREIMDTVNRYDYLFMACYPLLIAALFLFLKQRMADSGRPPPRAGLLAAAGICLCAVMLAADAYENLQLFKLTAVTDLGKMDPTVISRLMLATRLKSGAITLSGCILVYFYVRYFRRSWKLSLPLIYSISVVLGVIALSATSQRALIETGATIGMMGWIISTIHGGYWFFRKAS